MRKLCAGILVLTLAGCASTGAGRPSSQEAVATEDCTRLGAAAGTWASSILNPIKAQEKAITDCGRGDPYACGAVPGVFPFAILMNIIAAPVWVPLLILTSECPEHPSTTSADATGSDPQPGGTELREEEPAWPAERP